MIRKPSSFSFLAEMLWSCDLRRLKSACNTYAETSIAVATINPKVGMAKGPRCKKGIIDKRESDSFESIHDTTSELGVVDCWQVLTKLRKEIATSIWQARARNWRERNGDGERPQEGAR